MQRHAIKYLALKEEYLPSLHLCVIVKSGIRLEWIGGSLELVRDCILHDYFLWWNVPILIIIVLAFYLYSVGPVASDLLPCSKSFGYIPLIGKHFRNCHLSCVSMVHVSQLVENYVFDNYGVSVLYSEKKVWTAFLYLLYHTRVERRHIE